MKLTKAMLNQIIREEIEFKEARASDGDGLEKYIDASRDSLRPAVEKIMRETYIGGYAADGAPSLWDTIDSVSPGAGEKTLNSLVLSLANLQQFK